MAFSSIGIGEKCGNKYGVCESFGKVICKDENAAKCDAPSASLQSSEEVCNGKDDDCNGDIDDMPTKKDWDCSKKFAVCIGGKWECAGS